MMSPLSPQSVFITGANRGLGLEFVKQFLQLPQPPKYIFASCRHPDEATELQTVAKYSNSVHILRVDIRNDEEISAAVVEVENVVGDAGLNLLLNNAGINNWERGLDLLTREKLNDHFDVNVSGPMMVTKAFLPLLRKAAAKEDQTRLDCSRAAVVNLSTRLSLIRRVKQLKELAYPYCTGKCALNMATSILANEVFGDGILAVLLHPGHVKTDMGGPNASLEVPDAISQCMKTLSALDESSSGQLVKYNGTFMSWND